MNKRGHVLNCKKMITNAIIVLLIIANIFVGALNVNVRKPKCICDDCNRVRVTGTHYCSRHANLISEREICQKVINKNSN